MISVEDVTFQYRDGFQLRVPSLTIERGSQFALHGPSGSGKTTLLKLIAGIMLPANGTVRVDGLRLNALRDVERRNFRVRNIGFVFQEFELVEYLNVLDNILLPCRINRSIRLTPAYRERARALGNDLGLGDKLGRPIGRLSHGERQRVAICRAMLLEPSIILADEPTANLDRVTASRVVDELLSQAAASMATLVIVTHDQRLLERFTASLDCSMLTA